MNNLLTDNEEALLKILYDRRKDWLDKRIIENLIEKGCAHHLIQRLKKFKFIDTKRVWNENEETPCNKRGVAFPRNSSTRYYRINKEGITYIYKRSAQQLKEKEK